MTELKQNNKASQMLNKRIEAFREKNRKLLQTLQKKQRKEKQKQTSITITIQKTIPKNIGMPIDNVILRGKQSLKYICNGNGSRGEDQDYLQDRDKDVDRDYGENQCQLKVVKMPLNKLVPLTLQKYRQKIRML